MEITRNEICHVSKRNWNRLSDFLESKGFHLVSSIQDETHYQFINQEYQTYDLKYQDSITLNIYLTRETMTLHVEFPEEKKEYTDVAQKYLKLLYDTCYSIIEKDDAKEKAWKQMDRFVAKQNEKYLKWKEHHTSNVHVGESVDDMDVIDDILYLVRRNRRRK